MPLKSGKSRDTISSNIKKLVHEYDREGNIGASHPASRQKAIKQAVAISLSKAGVSRKQRKGARKSARTSAARARLRSQ